jgi:hypothetical protein
LPIPVKGTLLKAIACGARAVFIGRPDQARTRFTGT